ncbi:esterase-like activity of phytase family protein [Niveibacterium microcysteis]|uniref:esterase-like activity of phytase family protein n=1 Tax=Niveibacterium microcysteis TaxID=2811415 RepID=UPI001FE4EB17|nr:esterase-like activity of phytase family protein [Niveibacterium microcysteis]
MHKKTLIAALLAAITTPAIAAFDLVAIGDLNGSAAGSFADLSGLSGTLENGVAANILGGLGSGLAWAGGKTFIALPDRGPNAVSYNSAIDDTTSYIPRLQTVTMKLTASASGALPYTLTPTLSATTLLYSNSALAYGSGAGLGVGNGALAQNSAGKYYFSGRSDNFNAALPSTSGNNARLDPEGIRVSNDGKSVFVSDEYGPYVYQFDRATGARTNSFALPANLAVSNLSPKGDVEIAGNTIGRVANKGMEGLAITPDGKTLVGIMQAPLEQDTKKNVRIVTIDIASGTTHQYAYKLTTGSGVSEIVAINDHEFLVDERDGKGLGDNSSAAVKQFFRIDLAGAQDVSALSGDLSSKAVGKTLVLDFASKLSAAGVKANDIPAKIEGLSFGQDIVVGGETRHTLYVANDNDFLSSVTDSNHPAGIANPNKFYVFSFSDSDLPGYQAQLISAVPEPETYAMLLAGLGIVALGARRRRTAR